MKDTLEHASDILEAHWNKMPKPLPSKGEAIADMSSYSKDALDVLKRQLDFKPHPLDGYFFPKPEKPNED